MIVLDDCGKTLNIEYHDLVRTHTVSTKVQMVIKAPRGTLALWESHRYYNGTISYFAQDDQCEAIRLFMEEHRDR